MIKRLTHLSIKVTCSQCGFSLFNGDFEDPSEETIIKAAEEHAEKHGKVIVTEYSTMEILSYKAYNSELEGLLK